MLRADVVAAAEAGRFHVHAARTVDEAIELLTGVPAGELMPSGQYPEGTINRRVANRLAEFAAARAAAIGIPAIRKLRRGRGGAGAER